MIAAMSLDRGPFNLRALQLTFQPGTYDFTSFAAAELAAIDAPLADVDALTPDLVDLAGSAIDPLDGMDLIAATLEVVTQGQTTILSDIGAVLLAGAAADAQFAGVVAGAPAEAWIDLPAPFEPPQGPPYIDTPSIDASAVAGLQGSVITQPGASGGQQGRQLTLLNSTVYGSKNFKVSDGWIIQATGQPGEDVTVHAYVNGASIGTETIGQLDANGRLEQAGNFDAGDAGAWTEVWSIGGITVATYSFLVSPS